MVSANGHGEKLSRNGELLIAALLTSSTIPEAAKQVGISERSARYWLRRDDFQRAYRKARCEVLQAAIARLQHAAGQAVDALLRNLSSGVPSVEVRAADHILTHCAQFMELESLGERIAAIESALEKRQIAGFRR